MFAVQLHVSADRMMEMSIPQLVDHVDYWAELRGPSDG